MAKDGDFIMRPSQGWVIGLDNNGLSVNNFTKSIILCGQCGFSAL